jgi:hypothetical protein
MSVSRSVIKQLIEVGQSAILQRVEAMKAAEEEVSGDDVICAYVSMCRHALIAAKKHGVKGDVLVTVLQQIILEVSDAKGQVS